jgi:hypothetical protein
MRWAAACIALLLCGAAKAERILLVPLDSRPAAGQFAQMIGNMANVEVVLPPLEMLGRFTTPGNPERILTWLENQDKRDVSAIIVSADMIAFGGLIPSRTDATSEALAVQRMERFADLRRTSPETRLFVFSSIMRLAPTATRQTAAWRMELARYMEFRDRHYRLKEAGALSRMHGLLPKIPVQELHRYDRTRQRNHAVQRELIRMTAERKFDYLVIGQDDAKPWGPHIPESQRLRAEVARREIGGLVYFCEGIDQHSNVLVSRALLTGADWTPSVKIVYSDPEGRSKFANYESKTIEESLRDQILASGARIARPDEDYDFALYVNTPGRSAERFARFLGELVHEVDQGFPVSVADINLANDGTSDPELFQALWENARMMRLLSFAGWNTAGNTMGTSIPAANVYLLARRLQVDPLQREVAQREFVLHRFVNDYAFHKFTRPQAYRIIDSDPAASRDETYGANLMQVDEFVRQDLQKHLDHFFRDQFLGRRFFAGTGQYVFSELKGVKVSLPWPRAYEVRLEFTLGAQPVTVARSGD